MSRWIPSEQDLRRYMQKELEAAYQERHRVRCSREDFADGFLAALRVLHSSSSFLPGRFEPDEDE